MFMLFINVYVNKSDSLPIFKSQRDKRSNTLALRESHVLQKEEDRSFNRNRVFLFTNIAFC